MSVSCQVRVLLFVQIALLLGKQPSQNVDNAAFEPGSGLW
jgi:hypothetical protein